MPIQFEFYRTPNTIGTSRKRYYPRPVNFQCITTEEVSHNIQRCCSLTNADVRSVLTALREELASHLREGRRVHIEGLGYFQVTLEAPETRNPKDTRASSVHIKTVRFRPDKELKMFLENARIERSSVKPESKQWEDKAIEKKLTHFFEENPILTRRKLQDLLKLTQPTASRLIKRLIEEKKLKNIGTQHQPVYVPVPGNYGLSR